MQVLDISHRIYEIKESIDILAKNERLLWMKLEICS